MKLCIVKPDGSNAEILLSNKQPLLENINNELLFFENYQYKIIVRSEETIENLELFVGDYSIPLFLNSHTGCFETDKDLVFGGCFDLACVSLVIDDGFSDEKIYYSEYLRIATTKQTASQVEQMLYEIENNLPNFLEICFSRNSKRSGLIQNDIRSIWNTLRLIDEIIEVYDENYGYFNNHKKSSVEQEVAIVDVKSMKKIDQGSLIWLASNPDNLVESDKDSVIKYNDKNYIPSKVKTYITKYSYDTYENRMILGFLKSLIEYIDIQVSGFNREIQELENIPDSIIVQLPNTHELTGRCIYVYYKGVIEKFKKKRELLQVIYYRYARIFECVSDSIYLLPRLSNTFKQIKHYKLCYECMVKWFQAGDYSFDHLNYLFKLKTLSRIFEYYCLIKIQIAIVQNGYLLKEANRISDNPEDNEEEINNRYIFSGRGHELSLLYEPSIWVDKISNEINLYSTGYNFSKNRWNDRWTPDFVLKISSIAGEYYYILDAKYSNAQNVKKRYLPELVLKYSTQIASKDKFFSDVIGIGAIYPGEIDRISYYKKNEVLSSKPSLPKFFSLTILGEEEGCNALAEHISELLDIVDLLEESRPICATTQNEDIDIQLFENINQDNQIMAKNSLKDDISANSLSEINLVHGKKCFYYAKGMCLRQKTICSIDDKPCELYVNKREKDLLVEEDTCRNFIRYMNKGRLNRVECSVSGLAGCVGPEECKFYLKKKK